MSDYDFSTLNDKEFEELSRDILNAHFDLKLQSFKSGKDQGIDLKFATPENDNSLIVQAKHYRLSGISKLLSNLKSSELSKVTRLNPDRYILVTSIPLSPKDKADIRVSMSPYIQSSNDVLGKESLNQFLSEHEEVERRHFKLWLSSSALFLRFLNNAVDARSHFELEMLRNKARVFVPCQKLVDADSLLDSNKILVITGPPGVGKTTFAQILILDRARKEYEIHFVNTIREAEDLISPDDRRRQLFYIDDFLGSNYLELNETLSRETPLTSFVERIRYSPNKYLLLTTRTVFLNQAIDSFEKLRRSGVGNQKFELQLEHYSELDKAKIFHNHLYFSAIDEGLCEAVIKDKFYCKVIRHRNYTPRLIEYITKSENLIGLNKDDFRQHILRTLDNPAETWSHAFDQQIGEFERCLLYTLLSFPGSVAESELKLAFRRRLELERDENGRVLDVDQFEKSLRILQDAFISVHVIPNQGVRLCSFVNPSVADFLITRLRNSFAQRRLLVSSMLFITQLRIFAPKSFAVPLEVELQEIVLEKFISGSIEWSKFDDFDSETNQGIIKLLNKLLEYCKLTFPDAFILRCLSQLDLGDDVSDLQEIIEYIGENRGRLESSFAFVEANFRPIIDGIIQSLKWASDEERAWRVPTLFDLFNQSYWHYYHRTDSKEQIRRAFERIIEDLHTSHIIEPLDESLDIDEVRERYESLDSSYSLLEEYLFQRDGDLAMVPRIDFDEEYWEQKIFDNQERWNRSQSTDSDPIQIGSLNSAGVSNEIDDLFARLLENRKFTSE